MSNYKNDARLSGLGLRVWVVVDSFQLLPGGAGVSVLLGVVDISPCPSFSLLLIFIFYF